MDQQVWIEFGAVAVAHMLAVASPGPDFTLILRQSLRFGRVTARRSALGIGCGILVHVSYAVLGLGLVFRNSATAFEVLRWAGAGYLIWLGWLSIRSKGMDPSALQEIDETKAQPGSWRRGFLTNVLNPKAALFFITLYSVMVSPETSKWSQGVFGLWMAAWTALWFTFVAMVFTRPSWRQGYARMSVWVDRVLGIVFWGFALNLLVREIT